MTTKLAHRIVTRMRELDLTQEELAARVGVSQTTISKLITGKTERSRYIHDIAEVLQTTAAELIWGKEALKKGRMLDVINTDQSKSTPQVLDHRPAAEQTDVIRMGFYDVQTTTTGSATWLATDIHPPIFFTAGFFTARALDHKACRLLIAQGNSMAPRICDRDVVMIDTSQTRIVDGDVYALMVDGELYLRHVTRRPGKLLLTGECEDLDPVELPGDDVMILGRLVYRAG